MAIPSNEFLTAFGSVTYFYASAEFGIKATIGGILDIHTLDVLVMTEPLSSLALRNVAKSIMKDSMMPPEHQERFCWLVGEHGSFSGLRNAIGHNQWVKGARPGSMKPFSVSIREGHSKIIGSSNDEKDWTAAELLAEGGKLRKLNQLIVRFQHESGLSDAIARKDAETKARIEASLGSSTKDS